LTELDRLDGREEARGGDGAEDEREKRGVQA
jgi:hypothetical protein